MRFSPIIQPISLQLAISAFRSISFVCKSSNLLYSILEMRNVTGARCSYKRTNSPVNAHLRSGI